MIAVRLQDSGLASQDQPYRVIVKWKYKSLITCSFFYVWRLITSFPASGYLLDLPPPLLRMLDAPCFSPPPVWIPASAPHTHTPLFLSDLHHSDADGIARSAGGLFAAFGHRRSSLRRPLERSQKTRCIYHT